MLQFFFGRGYGMDGDIGVVVRSVGRFDDLR